VQAKMKGEKIISAPVTAPAPVIDLMAALKQSLEKDGGARKPAARGKREKAVAPPAKAPAVVKAPAAAAKPQARRRRAS
jgi:hypothetical protein